MSQDSLSNLNLLSQDSFTESWDLAGDIPNTKIFSQIDLVLPVLSDDFDFTLDHLDQDEIMNLEPKQENDQLQSCEYSTAGRDNGDGSTEGASSSCGVDVLRSAPKFAEDERTSDNLVIAMPDSTQGIPSMTNYPGVYGFGIIFQEEPEKMTKSTSCTYSERLDKLFINMGAKCIVCFRVEEMPPDGCVIRALPIFEKAENVREVVKRCPNHSLPADISNLGHKSPEHLVRCDNDFAVYNADPGSGRYSVLVPFVQPQAGTKHTEYIYEFMCFGSCMGGLNRRPLMLIFTLEKDGEVLGRRALRVRICACPGRDRKGEENHLTGSATAVGRKNPGGTGTAQAPSLSRGMVPKRPKDGTSSDEEVYGIFVKSKEHYEVLWNIKLNLELAEMVPTDLKETYLREQDNEKTKGKIDLKSNGSTSTSAKAKVLQTKRIKREYN